MDDPLRFIVIQKQRFSLYNCPQTDIIRIYFAVGGK